MIHSLLGAVARRGRAGAPSVAWVAMLAGALLSPPTPAQAQASRAEPRHVRVLSSQFHRQCPLAGPKAQALAIDSLAEWDSVLPGRDLVAHTGRDVRWSRERVIVYAAAPSPNVTDLVSPAKGLLLSRGILYWPVDEHPSSARAASKSDRSCLVSVVTRAYWQRIRVIDPSLIQRRSDDRLR